MSGEESAPQMAPVESPHVVSPVKLPILKKGKYTLWSMRIDEYLTNTDYALWQVIMNGDEPMQTTKDENGVETEVPPKTAQALLQRQRERKAKSILLLAIPDEYQLRFHGIKDAKTLWAAIKSRFGGNVESKKMQKNVLKQQFENFSVSDTEGLDKAYDRFQKLISLLEVHGAAVSNEDANQKFLRALPSSWNNVALIMRNKTGIDDLDIDDLYNNLKVFEADIKSSSGSSSNSQNVAFLSAEDTNSINEVNTANGVSTASGHNSQGQASSSKLDSGYHVVPPPLTGNYIPLLADLSFAGLDDSVYRPTANKTSASVSQVETSITQPSNTSVEMPRVESVRPIKPSFKKIEFTKARNEPVKSDKQAVKPRMVTQTPKGNPQQALKYKGMFDSGCSRHMTRNKALLTDYQDIDGGFVAFGGSTRGGKITGIGKIT
ncbi:hypothetical protein Tco_1152176, partial [Tanacetum coccineum]